jgi:predicted nucleic acid-binding protein
MTKTKKFLLETDILWDHLKNDSKEDSYLIRLMQEGICFTTVINASEMLFTAKSEEHKSAITKVLTALKVLGLNSRYSLTIGNYTSLLNSVRDAMIAVVAEYNNLPIVTFEKKFNKTKLEVIHPQDLRG